MPACIFRRVHDRITSPAFFIRGLPLAPSFAVQPVLPFATHGSAFPRPAPERAGRPDAGESPGRDFRCAPAPERPRGKTGKRRRLLSAPADFGRGGGCFSALHFCPAGSEGIAFLPFLPPRSGEGGEMNAPRRVFSFFRQAFLQKGRYLPACSGTVLLRHKGRYPRAHPRPPDRAAAPITLHFAGGAAFRTSLRARGAPCEHHPRAAAPCNCITPRRGALQLHRPVPQRQENLSKS